MARSNRPHPMTVKKYVRHFERTLAERRPTYANANDPAEMAALYQVARAHNKQTEQCFEIRSIVRIVAV